MTEKTDNSASQINMDKIDERFNKIDKNLAVLMERSNNLNDAVKKNSSDLMQIVSDLRLDMRHQANQNRVLYALSLALYASLVIALILIKFASSI